MRPGFVTRVLVRFAFYLMYEMTQCFELKHLIREKEFPVKPVSDLKLIIFLFEIYTVFKII